MAILVIKSISFPLSIIYWQTSGILNRVQMFAKFNLCLALTDGSDNNKPPLITDLFSLRITATHISNAAIKRGTNDMICTFRMVLKVAQT